MKDYSINNLTEIDTYLNSIDISVPLRPKGRKTEHTERYSIVNFLLQFKNEIFNDFPIKLVHSDRPVFRILTRSISIGIEITESIPEQLARAMFLIELHFPDGGLLEPQFFGWDAPDSTNDEILEILKKSNEKLFGPGFSGKSIEEEWMHGIYSCINNKTRKLNKDSFGKYSKNWLLIYDNQTRAFFDKDYLIDKFPIILNNYFDNAGRYIFDKITIESGSYFYVINSNKKPLIEIINRNVG